MWKRIKAFFEPQEMVITEADWAWMLANPEKAGAYIRARIMLG